MHDQEAPQSLSRPASPESPLTSSLYHATSTIDELTLALANFSRVPSPEPPHLLCCCCGREECDNTKSWLDFKSQLESRLILSAELGQALLQRHEAYVRRHEGRQTRRDISPDTQSSTQEHLDTQVAELQKEQAALEKRLTHALVNSEVAEISHKTVLQELHDARATISRLTAHHARSVGWDTRLSAAMKEKEDMQQERDSEAQRARQAESRIAALKERTSKLQVEVRRLQEDLEQRRIHRLGSSESILQDARVRLESLQHSLGHTAMAEQTELTKVLESLVEDNEGLKRDNAELQALLAEAREDLHSLQEQVDEQRVNPPSRTGAGTPHSRQYVYTGSMSSLAVREHSVSSLTRRNASQEGKSRRVFEPLTPETGRRPLSPADSLTASETKSTAFCQPQPRYPSSHISFEIEDDGQRADALASPEKPRSHKPLFLISRSRGVQTDGWPGLLSPFPLLSHVSSHSPHDPRSESSSYSESQVSHISLLVERVVSLLNRMTQADALTLTNRLKRQNLKGADVSHLSRSTVSNILSEVTGLRTQFRALLEDDKVITTCTRKDLRGLFKLFRDMFTELGSMRVTLNDVILDPSVAVKVSETALDPTKAESSEETERQREGISSSHAGGWMAPISKLFGGQGEGSGASRSAPLIQSVRGRGAARPIPRVIPKLGPALSASTTTVNVEFSGTGVGRSVTSTFSKHPPHEEESSNQVHSSQSSPRVMGIFAGAPRSASPDPWVILPKGPRRVQSNLKPDTLRRSTTKNGGGINQLSRQVDAVIDVQSPSQGDEEPDHLAPLLERTLRRRGLSESSIHSTFMSHQDESRSTINSASMHDGFSREIWPDRGSVFQTLSRKVQNFRLGGSNILSATSTPDAGTSPPQSSAVQPTPSKNHVETAPRAIGPSFSGLIPNLSSWAAAGSMLDAPTGTDPFFVGSTREDFSHRTPLPGETSYGREYF